MIITGNRTLKNLIEEKDRAFPDRPFILFMEGDNVRSTTYGEVDLLSNKLGNGLLRLGVGKGDKVILYMSNCPEFIISFFALAKIGAVSVPINTELKKEEIQHIVSHSEARLVIAEECYMGLFEEMICPRVNIFINTGVTMPALSRFKSYVFQDLLGAGISDPPRADLETGDDVLIIYTSGTTALPKGVIMSHQNLLYGGELNAKQCYIRRDDRTFVFAPLYHSYAWFFGIIPLATVGGSFVLLRKFSASQFTHQIRESKATILLLLAPVIKMILSNPASELDGQNSLRFGWTFMALPASDYERFEKRFNVPLISIYSLTEAGAPSLQNPLYGVRKNQTAGLPVIGCEVKIFTDDGQEAPPGTEGEIVIKHPILMKGYFKDPESTAQIIKDGWLYSGDIGSMDEMGYITFIDRKKDMIKRRGENISALEIEMVLNEHPKILESAVVGFPDELGDEGIKAFVVLKEGEKAQGEEISEFCAQRLARFKIPQSIEFVNSLPKNFVGKVMKNLLKKGWSNKSVI